VTEPQPICVVDAFTDRPFAGNPAAVCVLDAFWDDERLAAVAREMNVSETAYVVRRPDGDRDLRWFTPGAEVDLCGHATLATAHVLGLPEVRFHTRSGVLVARQSEHGWIDLDFPALPPAPATDVDAAALSAALGAPPLAVWRSRFDLLIELSDAATVRSLTPRVDALLAFGARGYIVTAAGDRDGVDVVSRFFAPAVGVPEDPVTGSAHCVLAPFWSERLGRTALVGEQASARGGIVRMRLAGDRVILSGRAVTTWQGELVV
jgi:predicted PhzF superfamily epimerase YddE/YHI9